jgi:hypothetical protein
MQVSVDFPAELPAGWIVKTVKRWGADAAFIAAGDFSVTIRLVGDPPHMVGQFQAVEPIIYGRDPDDTADRWSGDLSAITQFNRLTHADIMRLANIQLLPFGYPANMSDAEIMYVRAATLSDGYSLNQKMNWLINAGGGKANNVMWVRAEGGAPTTWYQASEVCYGTMVNGGQKVAVSEEKCIVQARLKNMTAVQPIVCHKLMPFKRADFSNVGLLPNHLLQYATVANPPNDGYGEYIRGHVICPVALDSNDFDFAGTFKPSAYYLPADWLV